MFDIKEIIDFNKKVAEDPLSLPVLLFIYWYYFPYYLAGNDEVDKWITSVSTNGARWSNLCKPYKG